MTRASDITAALMTVLDRDHAEALVAFRESRKTVKPFDLYRASLVVGRLKKAIEPNAAVYEMVNFQSNKAVLTHEFMEQVFGYDPETGILFKRETGVAVGSKMDSGYLFGSAAGQRHLVHRLIWLRQTGAWPKEFLDHRNHIRDDNRLSNLREASNSQNMHNVPLRRRNTSGATGVSPCKGGRWQAHIRIDGKSMFLGRFSSVEEGASAYRAASIKHFGEFGAFHGQ